MLKNKKDIKNLFLLLGLFAIILFLTTRFNYIYGSKVDWESQHWAFPEYFRNLFYSSHSLFPNFAFNIGAGQNIYYFAYYGLLSPIIFISYLLPFVKMVDYIMVSSICIVIITYILFYYFLRKNNFSSNIAFFATLIFLCASPLIFHSHRHIMFVSFLPMLLLGLLGVDRYFEKDKKFLLTFSSFLMIMTSYYYSVGGLIVIAIYGIYKYLSVTKKVTFKNFIKAGLKFCIPIVTAIMMSGILLLPTIGALTSRTDKIVDKPLTEYLIPSVNLEDFLYSPYSLGLTAIVIFALVSLFWSKKKQDRFLFWVLTIITIFPVFVYMLNGKLYLDPKCLIPFLPLYCLVIAKFIKDLNKNKYNLRFSLIIILIICILAFLGTERLIAIAFIIDSILLTLFLYLSKKKQKSIYLIYIVILSTIICAGINLSDELITKKEYKDSFNENKTEMIDDITIEDDSYYRFNNQLNRLATVNEIYNNKYYSTALYSSTFNKYYNKFYYDIFNVEAPYRNTSVTSANNNLLFDSFMGVKYVMSDSTPSIYHELISEGKKANVYLNKNALPLGYASANIYNEQDFYKAGYPYYLDSLFNGIVTNDKSTKKIESKIKKINLDLETISEKNIKITEDDHYVVKSKENGYAKYKIKNMPENSMLLIRFNLLKEPSCKDGDIYITINGVKNKLTCKEWKYANKNTTFDYLISDEKKIEDLEIEFSKGKFEIENIKTFVLNYDDIKYQDNFDELKINKIKGDTLQGTIDVRNDGYFAMTIPYDNGFRAYVDGNEVGVARVNTSFIGFPIEKGQHTIRIVYTAPYQKTGLIMSIFGVLCLVIIVIFDNRKNGKLLT